MTTGTFEMRPNRLSMWRRNGMHAYSLAFHSHVELIYVHTGKFDICIDGQNTTLHSGEMSVCFPYVPHQMDRTEAQVTVLLFDPAMCGGFLKVLGASKPVDPYLRKEQVEPIVPELLAMLLKRTQGQRTTDDDVMIPAYLTVLMGELLPHLTMTPLPMRELPVTRQILTYCMQNFQYDISAQSVAQALGISRAQVTRTFLRLRISFRDYINELRIDCARWFLTQTERPVTDILYESGFCNQGTFNRIFLKHCGITPSEYRALHAGENPDEGQETARLEPPPRRMRGEAPPETNSQTGK